MKEQENILEMVQHNPTTSKRRLSTRLSVSQTRVWQTLHEDGLCPFHPQCVKIYTQGNSAMHLEFCHWLHTNHQLLPSVLFTDKASFTIMESTTHVTHIDSLTTIHMVQWEHIFRVVSLSMCGAV